MSVTHEPWLVALSLIVAIQGAYVGLSLAVQVGGSAGLRRRCLLAGAAISLAVAIWSMHFVGMLATRLPFPVDYLVFPTLLSFLVCVLVVGAAIFAVSAGPPTRLRLAIAATAMGGGIVSMHYIGMTALHASAHMQHAVPFVVASVRHRDRRVGAGALACRRPRRPAPAAPLGERSRRRNLRHALYRDGGLDPALGRAPAISAPALSSDLLAIVVAIVAFGVSGIFLLTLVPDRSAVQGNLLVSQGVPLRTADALALAAAPASISENASPGSTVLGQGSRGPLGGAGGPPRRFAQHLPVERDGLTHYVAVDAVVAVHANAHYTYVFDGTTKLFCPLPISDVEARLDTTRFLRVHRSHIVNIERVVRLKRAGDNGMVELDAADPYAVPVSRSRVGWLKSRIGSRSSEAAHPSP